MAIDPLAKLREEEKKYTGAMRASSTALGGDQSPTNYDLANQVRLQNTKNKIQSIVDKQIQEKWYGPKGSQTTDSEGGQPGLMGRALHVFSTPLYAIEGAAESLAGKGVKPGFFANIAENVKEGHRTFGDLLSRSGAPYIISAPLGFALDVALDPVNWATAGATALVPRVAKPFLSSTIKEAGLRGAAEASLKGAQTSMLGRGITRAGAAVGRNIPKIGEETAVSLSKENINKGLAQKAAEYNAATGRDIGNIVEQRGFGGSNYRFTLRDVAEKAAAAIPGGENFMRTFDYNVNNWVKLARLKDTLDRVVGTNKYMEEAVQAYARGEDTSPIFKRMVAEAKSIDDIDMSGKAFTRADVDKFTANLTDVEKAQFAEISKNIVDDVDGAASIIKSPDTFITNDPVENAIRIAEEELGYKRNSVSREDLRKIFGVTMKEANNTTGVEWYDRMMDRVRGFKVKVKAGNQQKMIEVGSKVLDGYQGFIQAFKWAKVPSSPSAWTNAMIGNPVMASMSGENIFSPGFRKSFSDSLKFFRGKPGASAFIHDLLINGDMEEFIRLNPTAFSRTVGVSPNQLGARFIAERALMTGKDAGLASPWAKADDIAEETAQALTELRGIVARAPSVAEEAVAGTSRDKMGGLRMARELMKSRRLSPSELPSGYLSNELFDNGDTWFRDVSDHIAARAADPQAPGIWKMLNLMVNKAGDGYETIDQVWKMTTFRNAVMYGYTEGELMKLRNVISLDRDDLMKGAVEGGQQLYKLSPAKALELANANYLNYNAMPAAIKMMRNLPILGSPFISFMYGMLMKTGNTVVHNPAIFNKISFGLNDFGGTQTPLEKKALDGKYYSYLDDPGMLRLPFFQQHPVYLNVANMIPYYSFNMFNPSERRYDDLLPNALVSAIDRSPFVKDPVASVLFDYFILPQIIGEAQPVGSFGQPLYPYGASGGEKFLYGLRSLAETVVPSSAAVGAGLTTGLLSEQSPEWAPSYRWRQVANAVRGKNQYGKSTKEAPMSKTARALLSTAGVPTNVVDLTYTSNEVKKKLK